MRLSSLLLCCFILQASDCVADEDISDFLDALENADAEVSETVREIDETRNIEEDVQTATPLKQNNDVPDITELESDITAEDIETSMPLEQDDDDSDITVLETDQTEEGTGMSVPSIDPENDETGSGELSEIEVYGEKTRLPSFQIDRTQSSTKISIEEIKRRNAIDVMELIEDIPGISAVGGVRGGSKGFTIRGFSDNEDILTVIDGARQNFERYRSGSEIDITPNLLQEIEVIRGSNVRYGGTGTLGGAVIMKTKNARDLLEPGEQAGLEFKTAYFTNNNQKTGGFTAFAQPVSFADVLFNITKESSNDVTQPDGDRLDDSSTKKLSSLIKLGLFGEQYELDLGYRLSDQSLLEPFNQFEEGNTSFIFARRQKTTRSPTANFKWEPDSDLINIHGSYAYNDQLVEDKESTLISGGTDRIGYKILNIELLNRSNLVLGPVNGKVDIGTQYSRERRSYVRELPNGITGFNEAQPPGEKLSYGAFLDASASWRNVTLDFGFRYDEYDVTAGGASEEALLRQGNDTTDSFDAWNFGTGISYQPASGPLTLFYNYKQSFRVPLIDQLYAKGTASNCSGFSEFIQTDDPSRPVIADFLFLPGGGINLNATEDFQNALTEFLNQPDAVANATCIGFYEPETSNTHEIGFSMNWDNLFKTNGTINSKLTYYQIRTDHILESIYQDSVTNEVSQPGKEYREGFEVELSYDSDTWFTNFSISTIDGYIAYNFFENNRFFTSDPSLTAADISVLDTGKNSLFNIPGDSLSLSLGYKLQNYNMEYGYRLRVIGNRRISTGINNSIAGCGNLTTLTIAVCNDFTEQAGYSLHNIFASWQPHDSVRIGITMNNITNKLYFTDGFSGGQGNIAAGRDFRMNIDWRF